MVGSGCDFCHQRSMVRIQSSANLIYCIEKTKVKLEEAGNDLMMELKPSI